MIRRSGTDLVLFLVLFLTAGCAGAPDPGADPGRESGEGAQPNIIMLFADDMGYGDLSSYGNPQIHTPHLDRLANRGVRLRSFYVANWCVPSRVQLMTGRYRSRVVLKGSTSVGGGGRLPEEEQTLPEGLRNAGYATGMAGKWHLGYKKEAYLPTGQGFDSWFGLPYSNDMRKPWVPTDEPLWLYRGSEKVEHPVNQDTLTVRYTEEAVEFIREHGRTEKPFFFYLAYSMPHLPIHTAERFRGRSDGGLYGDVIETIDWSVGQVLEALEEAGVRDHTIVCFASDNGPWLDLPDRMLQEGNKRWHAGSPGPLRGHKATTYEGGHRVPAILHWPGEIEGGWETSEIVAVPDLYRTFLHVGGGTEPDHRLDGHNMLPFLTQEEDESPREEFLYFRNKMLGAYRSGDWKLRVEEDEPQLFNLSRDPGERFNRADEKPKKVKKLYERMRRVQDEFDRRILVPALR